MGAIEQPTRVGPIEIEGSDPTGPISIRVPRSLVQIPRGNVLEYSGHPSTGSLFGVAVMMNKAPDPAAVFAAGNVRDKLRPVLSARREADKRELPRVPHTPNVLSMMIDPLYVWALQRPDVAIDMLSRTTNHPEVTQAAKDVTNALVYVKPVIEALDTQVKKEEPISSHAETFRRRSGFFSHIREVLGRADKFMSTQPEGKKPITSLNNYLHSLRNVSSALQEHGAVILSSDREQLMRMILENLERNHGGSMEGDAAARSLAFADNEIQSVGAHELVDAHTAAIPDILALTRSASIAGAIAVAAAGSDLANGNRDFWRGRQDAPDHTYIQVLSSGTSQ